MTTSRSVASTINPRRWMRAGSVLISFAAVTLLVGAFGAKFYSRSVSSILLTLVLIALCTAIALHVRFLILARREHRETSSALDATEREFKSIFDNALDGILILDDRGTCLEANPAAQTLFGARYHELVGQPIGNFYAGGGDFTKTWQSFLDRKYEHGETKLSKKNGPTIFVEYTAKGDYLPGKHVAILRDISRRKETEAALSESEQRFQQMAANIQEIFWMLDADTKEVIYVNQAFETITGRSRDALRESPTSYQELFHPEDRVRVLTRLEEAVQTGHLDEEFRIIRPDHATRWVWARGFPVRDSTGAVHRLVGTAQDITARKSAEEQMARSLMMAESAGAEADAFRKTTLALTQNLSMDYVLDTLLQSILRLIPCESARVLLLETDARLFLAREVQRYESNRHGPKCASTWAAADNHFLMRVLASRNSLLIRDTSEEKDWAEFKGNSHFRSWLCVPLTASQSVIGLLSLGDTQPQTFTPEHLRLAKSLAIPAAVAIQNARLYERAEIYGAELERRLADLQQTQQALREAQQGRTLSEERFSKVFRSSPIAFSITTVAEGRFIDVNEAFERRYGFSSTEVLGRTAFDIGVWDNPSERSHMLDEISKHGQIRNRITRFRTRSGEFLDTIYSADIIELEGQQCLLAVSEELPDSANLQISLDRKAAAAQ
jgi:PAS domain S-box-containing protein